MEKGKTKNNNKTNKEKKSAQEAGFFQLTKQQLALNIDRYNDAISNDNTVFKAKYSESQNTPVVLKKRINYIDSKRLEESAYNVLDDNHLRLSQRIKSVKTNIAEIDEKILVAQTVKDSAALDELNLQRRIMVENLRSLFLEYKTQKNNHAWSSAASKLFGLPKVLKNNVLRFLLYVVKQSPLFKKIRPLMRSFLVQDTIHKLNKINKSIDELVNMQVPFGEQDARYATLVNQLTSAGALHNQILKEFES